MTLGERILLLRRRKRLTQDELAAQSGVNKMTIWRLEHGAINDVKGRVLGKMALALDTTADYLLGLREDDQSGPQPASREPALGAQPAPQPPAKRPQPRKAAPVG
jgi:transcriptional regulator with XRE-family HTH domain